MAFPFDPDPTGVWLTAFKFNQAVSEHLILFAGKINGLDGYALKYSPGVSTNLPGLGGFQSMGLTFNPIAARGVPYSAAAAGAAVLFGEGSSLAFSVLDPAERSDRGMDNLFDGGATLATDLVLRRTHQLELVDAGCRPRVRWIRGASAIISSASATRSKR